MKNARSQILTSPTAVEIRRLADSVDLLFGKSPEGGILAARCHEAIEELESFADGRGVDSAIIAVLGAKNSGKSWLCRLLVKDEVSRERIPSGETSQFATVKATWIGPDAPPALDTEHEIRIVIRPDAMVDLKASYTLLDLPGYNDASIPAREAALKAVRGAPLRILVISSATKDVESQFEFLENSDGTRILPVVVDDLYPDLENESPGELVAMAERIRRHCPHAEVLEPVVVPHVLHAPGETLAKIRIAEERLFPKLRQIIAAAPADENVIGNVVIERLRRRLAGDLREFVRRVSPAHAELEKMESGLASELVAKILGPDPQLQAGLRMKMRLLALSRTPGWFFPFRTFSGVFAITAGAWDRMAFAMAGSLPSLALLIFQTAKNTKRLAEMKDDVRTSLARHLESMARDALADKNRIFIRSINSSLPTETQRPEEGAPHTRFVGLDRVTEESGAIFERVISVHACGRAGLFFWGGSATLLFVGLLSGPLLAVYREFGHAWIGVFRNTPGFRWQEFPAPAAGMIFTSLALALLPVIFCALVCCLRTTPAGRVQAALAAARAEHKAMLERLAHDKTIHLFSEDPIREASRFVLNFLGRL
jgi:hypothetical protein